MKRKGLCLIHERHEIHEKWGCGFVIFVARAFQPEICPAGSLVSGVFFTTEGTEGTEVEWLCGVGGCLVSREAAKPRRSCGVVVWGLCEGGFAPSPPAPLPRWGRGVPRMRGVFFATDEHGFSRMKREGLCLIHERHEIHEKWGLWFCDFCSSGFPARDLSRQDRL